MASVPWDSVVNIASQSVQECRPTGRLLKTSRPIPLRNLPLSQPNDCITLRDLPSVVFSAHARGTPAFCDATLTGLLFSRSTRVASGQGLESFISARLKRYREYYNRGSLSRIEIQVKALKTIVGYGYSCTFISDKGVNLTEKIGKHKAVTKIFANECKIGRVLHNIGQVLRNIPSQSRFALSNLAYVAAILSIVVGGPLLFAGLIKWVRRSCCQGHRSAWPGILLATEGRWQYSVRICRD